MNLISRIKKLEKDTGIYSGSCECPKRHAVFVINTDASPEDRQRIEDDAGKAANPPKPIYCEVCGKVVEHISATFIVEGVSNNTL